VPSSNPCRTTPFPFHGVGSKEKGKFSPEDVVLGLPRLPSAPAILPRMITMLSDEHCPLDDVADLLKTDQGLTAQILVLGSSAFYGGRRRCTSVDEAIRRVGYLKIYEMVAYAASVQLILRPNRTYGLEPAEVWRLSVTAALAMERMANKNGLDPKAAYTIGLLHGAGLVVFDLWCLKQGSYWDFMWQGFPDDCSIEEKTHIGFDNATVAAALLTHWKFPADIVEPIRFQYIPDAAGPHRKAAYLLHVAKWIRDTIAVGDEAFLPPMPKARILAPLQLTAEDLKALRLEVKAAYTETISLHRVLAPAGS
jgi:HD-like signal output (HDOD) protein